MPGFEAAGVRAQKGPELAVTDRELTCLFARQLIPEAYLMGDLSGVEREIFERHFAVCLECATAVKAGSALIGFLRKLK